MTAGPRGTRMTDVRARGSPIWLGTRREPGRAGAKPGGAGRGGFKEGIFVTFAFHPQDSKCFHTVLNLP